MIASTFKRYSTLHRVQLDCDLENRFSGWKLAFPNFEWRGWQSCCQTFIILADRSSPLEKKRVLTQWKRMFTVFVVLMVMNTSMRHVHFFKWSKNRNQKLTFSHKFLRPLFSIITVISLHIIGFLFLSLSLMHGCNTWALVIYCHTLCCSAASTN